ncbi:alanine racemase C-terminal domain-containing protein [Microbacterium sp. P03]|uniref:alanine racemase C-terminal domain-containing protein n=1 Tax=Microbacterium sp. P03 TaxID=3366946 RepID=UPI0037453D70
MTSETAEHPPSAGATARRTAPTATISASALQANVALLSRTGAITALVGALTHDAWGHGAAVVDEAAQGAAGGSLVADGPLRKTSPWQAAAASLFGLPGSEGRPVLRLTGAVLSVKRLFAGEGVSYGYTHHAPTDTHVALVTGGYAQGVVRTLGNHVDIAIGGVLHRIVGRVAMDVCVVDVGDALVRRGDEAVFFGDPAAGEPSLAAWATVTGLTPREIVTVVGQRAYRIVGT